MYVSGSINYTLAAVSANHATAIAYKRIAKLYLAQNVLLNRPFADCLLGSTCHLVFCYTSYGLLVCKVDSLASKIRTWLLQLHRLRLLLLLPGHR